MEVKKIQTKVLLKGLRYLYYALGGMKSLPIENINIPSCITNLSEKIFGKDFFSGEENISDSGFITSVFSEVCFVANKQAYTKVVPCPVTMETLPWQKIDDEWKHKALVEIENNYINIKDNPIAILLLLEKYGSFIRVSDIKDCDSISLFELTRFLASIAAYSQEGKEHSYLLIGGDFSGIQNFIYAISSHGALKGLRGRSFFLELFCHHIIDEILGKELTQSAVVQHSGGNFILLVPNSELFIQRLNILKDKINKYLLEQMQGKIFVSLCWVDLKINELLADFSQKLKLVSDLLEKEKFNRFQNELDTLLTVVEPFQKGKEEECQICHRDDLKTGMASIKNGDEEIRTCLLCKKLYKAGGELANCQYILKFNGVSEDEEGIVLPGIQGESCYKLTSEKSGNYKLCYIKNSFQLEDYLDGKSLPFLYADYVASENNKVFDVNFIAKKAVGKKLVGALRMDVDHLGITFTKGFSKNRFDIIRYSALSRQINYFFSIYLNILCKTNKLSEFTNVMNKDYNSMGRSVSVIYAGGDDLFVVGAWSDVTELSCDIASSFKNYVNNNPHLTISGGVFLSKPDFPLYQMARLSGIAVDEAKKCRPTCQRNKCSDDFDDCPLYEVDRYMGKCKNANAGLLFYQPLRVSYLKEIEQQKKGQIEARSVFPWQEINQKILPMVKMFCSLRDMETTDYLRFICLPKGFIYRLFNLIRIWEERGILYLPFAYNMARQMQEALISVLNTSDPTKLEVKNSIRDLICNSTEKTGLILDRDTIKYLWVCLTWVEYLSRNDNIYKQDSGEVRNI